jgi:HK97 family phage prohead protease
MNLQYKQTEIGVADMEADKGIVTLYASAFGNKDSDGDVMQKGAFTKTIKERGPEGKNRIKHLYQHNRFMPIGTPLEMKEDENGLRIVSKVSDINNGDYIKLYRDGVITEHSIGFEILKSDKLSSWNEAAGEDVQIIKEVKLWEYSAVTWGANENTPVVGMKSHGATPEDADKIFERLTTMQKAFRKGDYTDETYELLQLEIEDMKSYFKSLLSAEQPATATTSAAEPTLLDIYKSLI